MQTIPGAKEFFTRRATFLKSKIEELQPVVMSKVKEKNMVEGVRFPLVQLARASTAEGLAVALVFRVV